MSFSDIPPDADKIICSFLETPDIFRKVAMVKREYHELVNNDLKFVREIFERDTWQKPTSTNIANIKIEYKAWLQKFNGRFFKSHFHKIEYFDYSQYFRRLQPAAYQLPEEQHFYPLGQNQLVLGCYHTRFQDDIVPGALVFDRDGNSKRFLLGNLIGTFNNAIVFAPNENELLVYEENKKPIRIKTMPQNCSQMAGNSVVLATSRANPPTKAIQVYDVAKNILQTFSFSPETANDDSIITAISASTNMLAVNFKKKQKYDACIYTWPPKGDYLEPLGIKPSKEGNSSIDLLCVGESFCVFWNNTAKKVQMWVEGQKELVSLETSKPLPQDSTYEDLVVWSRQMIHLPPSRIAFKKVGQENFILVASSVIAPGMITIWDQKKPMLPKTRVHWNLEKGETISFMDLVGNHLVFVISRNQRELPDHIYVCNTANSNFSLLATVQKCFDITFFKDKIYVLTSKQVIVMTKEQEIVMTKEQKIVMTKEQENNQLMTIFTVFAAAFGELSFYWPSRN